MEIFFLIIFIAVIFLFIKSLLKGVDTTSKYAKYNYRRKHFLVTKPENEFFHILSEVIGDRYYLFPQVHLDDIVDYKVKGQNWKAAFNHINRKSVDYILCDKQYLKPVLAIELDDSSHDTRDRVERDTEVERILAQAGLPLVRFRGYKQLSQDQITTQIRTALAQKPKE